jgi:hypothetical protein
MQRASCCEIYSVGYKNAVRWKWRYLGADGRSVDCVEQYELLFDCVRAARAQGYEPRAQWTACARVAGS